MVEVVVDELEAVAVGAGGNDGTRVGVDGVGQGRDGVEKVVAHADGGGVGAGTHDDGKSIEARGRHGGEVRAEAFVEVEIEPGGGCAVGAGGGGNEDGHVAGDDLVGRRRRDGQRRRRGERRGEGIAGEQALVRGGDGHGVGLADGEAAGVEESHERVGELFEIGAGLVHGAEGRRGADAHPIEHGGLGGGVRQFFDAAAVRRQQVGVGAGLDGINGGLHVIKLDGAVR